MRPFAALASWMVFVSVGAVASPPVPAPSTSVTLTSILNAIPVSEVGIPEEIRTDGREFLVVPWRAQQSFWILDAEQGNRRRVTVHPPEVLSSLTVRSVDRIGKGRLVASASWVEAGVSRSGLLFLDDEGNVDRYGGYGFSVRSIVVGPTKDWIVASIQEPQDPTSEEINRPTVNAIAQFGIDGKLGLMQSCALPNMVATFEESLRTLPLRRVFLARDSVVLTYPFILRGGSPPAAWIEGTLNYRSPKETKSGRSTGLEQGPSFAPLHWPRLGGEQFRGAKPLGIVPVVTAGKSGLLAAWLTRGSGEPEDRDPASPRRDQGRLLLTLYDMEGKDARKVEEITDGTRIGELTSSPDGTAYAVTFRDISKEWSISRIDF